MQYDNTTSTLSATTSSPASAAPLVANGKLAFLPAIATSRGFDTSRCVIARNTANYGAHFDAFHPCRLRIATQPDGKDSTYHTLTSHCLDMADACFKATFNVSKSSTNGVICTVDHTLRVLRQTPNFALHTIVIDNVPGTLSNLVLFHELRADVVLSDAAFDSTVIAFDDNGSSAYMMTGSAKAQNDGGKTSSVYAVSCYLFEAPERAAVIGFNATRATSSSAACGYTRMRLAFGGTAHRQTFHILTGIMSDDDMAASSSPPDQLRRVVLSALGRETNQVDVANNAIQRHRSAWADLWNTDVVLDPKPGMNAADAAATKAFAASLKYAMYNLHASARPGSIVDLGGTVAAGAGHSWIVPMLILFQPDAALTSLDARFEGLEGARKAASAFGFRGAKFLYQGDDNGGTGALDASLYWDADAPLRIFNSAMVAIDVWDYYRTSADRDWLQDRGYAVLRAVADLVCSATVMTAPSIYHIPAVLGLDASATPANDNAVTVACAQLALRAAMEAAYELGYVPKETWGAVRYGLAVPFLAGAGHNDILAKDASDATASQTPPALVRLAEPLLVLTTRLNAITFGTDSPRTLVGAVTKNLVYWNGRLDPTVDDNAVNQLIIVHASAQQSQVDATTIADFSAACQSFFDTHRCALGYPNLVIGSQDGADGNDKDNDLALSAMFIQAIVQGLGGLTVTGGVTETRFYYAEMGVVAPISVALPITWERLHINGIGQRSFTSTNRILYPQAPMSSNIVPWTVDNLSYM